MNHTYILRLQACSVGTLFKICHAAQYTSMTTDVTREIFNSISIVPVNVCFKLFAVYISHFPGKSFHRRCSDVRNAIQNSRLISQSPVNVSNIVRRIQVHEVLIHVQLFTCLSIILDQAYSRVVRRLLL